MIETSFFVPTPTAGELWARHENRTRKLRELDNELSVVRAGEERSRLVGRRGQLVREMIGLQKVIERR